MDLEVKNKIKKGCLISYLIVSTLSLILVIIACIVGFSGGFKSNVKVNADNEISYNINRENKKQITFGDNVQSVTFSVEELNNYQFINLVNYINDNSSTLNDDQMDISVIDYNSNTFTFDDWSNELNFNYVNDNLSYNIWLSLESGNWYYDNATEEITDFSYSITWFLEDVTPEEYQNIVNAIQLDIQANENQGNINDSIFGTLTTSVVAFIGSLSSGIVAMTTIFYTNNALTVIGLLSVIVVAVSLAYWLFRLIIGLIRMRG